MFQHRKRSLPAPVDVESLAPTPISTGEILTWMHHPDDHNLTGLIHECAETLSAIKQIRHRLDGHKAQPEILENLKQVIRGWRVRLNTLEMVIAARKSLARAPLPESRLAAEARRSLQACHLEEIENIHFNEPTESMMSSPLIPHQFLPQE